MTCEIPSTSIPRAIISVATKTVILPSSGQQRPLSGVLTLVRVNRIGRNAIAGKVPRKAVGAMLGSRKHQSSSHIFAVQDFGKQQPFVDLVDEKHLLINIPRNRCR